jgi:hypothetical protein
MFVSVIQEFETKTILCALIEPYYIITVLQITNSNNYFDEKNENEESKHPIKYLTHSF